jgi:hypothetical protein
VEIKEFDAGANQLIVVYQPADTGEELDSVSIFGYIAGDSETRAQSGQRIVSIAVMANRHSAVAFGREGSGYQTKASIAVVYSL